MSNILIISAVFPPEPVVSALLSRDLANELSKKNNVTVICPSPTRPAGFSFEKRMYSEHYNIIQLNSYTCPSSKIFGRFRESYSFGSCCVKFIKESTGNIQCIYINSWPLLSQFMIVNIAKRKNIPCVLHIQDIYPESLINKMPFGKSILFKILLPIDKYSLLNSNSIIAISENMKKTLINTRNVNSTKIEVVTNWQDDEAFLSFHKFKIQSESNSSKGITFMHLGNNGPLAGVNFIIRSFFKAEIEHSKLIIAGSGTRTNSCIALVKSIKANNIEFVEVPQGMVPSIQDLADVLLLPVKKNGAMSSIPSKLPAYMFSAKPIIGCLDLESDTAKAINDSGCGIVIEPENEIELINAMKSAALWSEKTREEKGNSGLEFAKKSFSKEINIKKIISIIENVIKWN